MRNTATPTALPFVGYTAKKESLSFWTVPQTGDFAQGVESGTAMANALTAHLMDDKNHAPILPQIALDMIASGDLPPALQGQVVGFFSALEEQLKKRSP